MRRLEGKNVLITGGSTGIGRSTAIRFADEGANVAINYHTSEREAEITLEEARKTCSLIREKGCRDLLVQGDVAREEDVQRIFREILGAWGRLDIRSTTQAFRPRARPTRRIRTPTTESSP